MRSVDMGMMHSITTLLTARHHAVQVPGIGQVRLRLLQRRFWQLAGPIRLGSCAIFLLARTGILSDENTCFKSL